MPNETAVGATMAELGVLTGGRLTGDPQAQVTDVTHDSRQAAPGVMFVAVRGAQLDGHRFVGAAAAAGAAGVCVEDPQRVDVPQLVVEDTRRALGLLAARVHGYPSRRIPVAGVTGTNGKTTVTHLLASIAEAAGVQSGLLGTIGARSGRRDLPIERTTPEASDLQRLLAAMVADGDQLVAMEVSSHALALGRVSGMEFAVAGFTNLSQDHLDFHGSMEAYFDAKTRLFEMAERAVVCVDDPWGERLTGRISIPCLRVGSDGDLRAVDARWSRGGTTFTLVGEGSSTTVDLPLPGRFNVANALVAAGCALVLGFDVEAIAAGLSDVGPVRGRFEGIDLGQDYAVFVDYAHTPEGISEVIGSARDLTDGRVIVVFGAGGDRDESKRPLMGTAAGLADAVWVTSDNPRSEDPDRIIDAVVAGVPETAMFTREPDRAVAIRRAVAAARSGDVVLILGKGHEQGQDFGDRVVPFDDRAHGVAAIEERKS